MSQCVYQALRCLYKRQYHNCQFLTDEPNQNKVYLCISAFVNGPEGLLY